jgi:hypothetical protein
VEKRPRNEIATPIVASEPSEAAQPIHLRGSCEATIEVASGSQIKIESVIG